MSQERAAAAGIEIKDSVDGEFSFFECFCLFYYVITSLQLQMAETQQFWVATMLVMITTLYFDLFYPIFGPCCNYTLLHIDHNWLFACITQQ